MNKIQRWLESGGYLPLFMRDFHDQKDLFKCIHARVEHSPDDISWVQGQIYVIDKFLWFMARRGYTLQKNRSKFPFADIREDIRISNEARAQQFASMLNNQEQRSV